MNKSPKLILAHSSQEHFAAHTSQQWQGVHGLIISLKLPKCLNSKSLRHWLEFRQKLSMGSDTNCLSPLPCSNNAHVRYPSLPPLPLCWIMASMSDRGPQSILCRTSGQSKPIPNAIVAITIHSIPLGSQNDLMIVSLMSASVHLQYISTSLFLAKSRLPLGSVNPSLR